MNHSKQAKRRRTSRAVQGEKRFWFRSTRLLELFGATFVASREQSALRQLRFNEWYLTELWQRNLSFSRRVFCLTPLRGWKDFTKPKEMISRMKSSSCDQSSGAERKFAMNDWSEPICDVLMDALKSSCCLLSQRALRVESCAGNEISIKLSTNKRKFKLSDVVTFSPCGAQQRQPTVWRDILPKRIPLCEEGDRDGRVESHVKCRQRHN